MGFSISFLETHLFDNLELNFVLPFLVCILKFLIYNKPYLYDFIFTKHRKLYVKMQDKEKTFAESTGINQSTFEFEYKSIIILGSVNLTSV